MTHTASSVTGLEDVFTKQVTTCSVWPPRSTDLNIDLLSMGDTNRMYEESTFI
jgi:hypothetical protein